MEHGRPCVALDVRAARYRCSHSGTGWRAVQQSPGRSMGVMRSGEHLIIHRLLAHSLFGSSIVSSPATISAPPAIATGPRCSLSASTAKIAAKTDSIV